MDDSVLWAVAIGSGVLGLLLLSVAGLVVLYLNGVARRPQKAASDDRHQSQAEDVAAEGKRLPVHSVPSPGLWLKAWLFAVLHASTVSMVVGGITFLEDLSKASEEIQNVGRVSFPKQLLPGPLTGAATHRQLSEATGWEVVDRADGAGEDGQPGPG
ncbi:MAG TPA: hypothetical protein ENN99_03285 [Chloroflexi bacterium]|nr:hypothetical protein [Chloroflexota bacterium]